MQHLLRRENIVQKSCQRDSGRICAPLKGDCGRAGRGRELGSDSSRSSPANDSRNFTSVRMAPARVPEVAIPSSASLQTPNPPSKGGLSTSAQNSFSPLPTEAEAEVSAQEFADRRLMEKISEGEAQWGGYEEFKEAFRAGLLRGEADWAILARSVGD